MVFIVLSFFTLTFSAGRAINGHSVCVCLCICACMCVCVCACTQVLTPTSRELLLQDTCLASTRHQCVWAVSAGIAQPCTCDPHWQGSPGALGLGDGGVGAEEAEVETATFWVDGCFSQPHPAKSPHLHRCLLACGWIGAALRRTTGDLSRPAPPFRAAWHGPSSLLGFSGAVK